MARHTKKRLERTEGRLTGDMARFYAFVIFFGLVFLMGGSARDDVQSLKLLRPLAVVFGTYAVTCMDGEFWRGRRFPLSILLALAGLMVLQLIPLPPNIWAALPGRHVIADIADLAGIEQSWRPLTLSPSRTLNSLFSLAIPIAAMMLYLNLDTHRRRQSITVIIGFATFSALWAAFQLTGSARGPLYLYNITNEGAAVGLFANRNHQAVLLAATIVMIGWYGASHSVGEKLASLKFYAGIAAIFILVPLIFVTGSRAGLILMAPALIAAISLFYFGRYSVESQPSRHKGRAKRKWFASREAILVASVVLVSILAGLSIYFSRAAALERLVDSGNVDELRSQLLPILIKMLGDYFPWGSGFGSFELVYRIYEPLELLNPSYLNQAHNDWLQFPIEGGLPAILIATLAIIWAAMQMLSLVKNWQKSRYSQYLALTSVIVMVIFLAGSAGDYPLRVPSIMAVFAVMACILGDSVRAMKLNGARS